MISEVKTLLIMREAAGRTAPDTAVFKKTKAYVDTFSKFSEDSARSVREALSREIDERGLTQFEIAQIANLCPATSEEAKNCIPSLLTKIDDDRLQAILDEVATLRRFQS